MGMKRQGVCHLPGAEASVPSRAMALPVVSLQAKAASSSNGRPPQPLGILSSGRKAGEGVAEAGAGGC